MTKEIERESGEEGTGEKERVHAPFPDASSTQRNSEISFPLKCVFPGAREVNLLC